MTVLLNYYKYWSTTCFFSRHKMCRNRFCACHTLSQHNPTTTQVQLFIYWNAIMQLQFWQNATVRQNVNIPMKVSLCVNETLSLNLSIFKQNFSNSGIAIKHFLTLTLIMLCTLACYGGKSLKIYLCPCLDCWDGFADFG